MNLHEFTSLAEAQAYTVTTGKMISPDMMVALMTQFDVISAITTGTSKECQGITLSLQFGSEFNLITDNPIGETLQGMLAQMVTDNIVPQLFMDTVIAYANVSDQPFYDKTQEDYDAAVLEQALKNPIDAHSYTLQGFETNAVNAAIVKSGRELIVDVIFDAPVSKDCVVSVTALLQDTATGEYVPETASDSVRVSTGSTSKNYRIKRNFSARKMKFEATCNYGFPFQVKVAEA